MSGVILLTGFDAFGGDAVNPSIDLARALEGEVVDGSRVVAEQLPCEFARSTTFLFAALERWSPRLVLAIGQAGGRADLSFERIAINLIDARIADNAGAQPIDVAVDPDGPAAYFSTLPIKRMAAAVRRAGVPASISYSAGSFVCNQIFYALQHRLAGYSAGIPGGFMHVPLLPEQAVRRASTGQAISASMALAQMVLGTRVALQAALRDPVPGMAGLESSEGILS
ncbi:MAG: pyroglutamyl-peptidase I [Ideonella sp.]